MLPSLGERNGGRMCLVTCKVKVHGELKRGSGSVPKREKSLRRRASNDNNKHKARCVMLARTSRLIGSESEARTVRPRRRPGPPDRPRPLVRNYPLVAAAAAAAARVPPRRRAPLASSRGHPARRRGAGRGRTEARGEQRGRAEAARDEEQKDERLLREVGATER